MPIGRGHDGVAIESPLAPPNVTVHLAWHARAHRDPLHAWLRRLIKMAAEKI